MTNNARTTRAAAAALLLAALAPAPAPAAPARAATAVAPTPAAASTPAAAAEALTAQEREMLAIANDLSKKCGETIERWIAANEVSEDRLWSALYYLPCR